MTNVPVKPISEIEVKSEVSVNDKILILDSVSEEARLASKSELKGDKGDQWNPWTPWKDGKDWSDWAAATVTVWSTTTWDAWTSASVTNSGTSSAAVLNFTIPKGAKWDTGSAWKDGADGKDWTDWNGIASITSSKTWKITTVTITETNGDSDSFEISDWADWQWSWDVIWPSSSTDWHLAVFDWVTWKLIKDWGTVPTWFNPWEGTTGQVLTKTADWYEWDDATWGWSDIVYATQAEYNALLPWAASDWKHYFIYTSSTPTWWIPTANTIAYWELNGNWDDTKNDYWVTTYTATDYDSTWYVWSSNPTYLTQRKWKYCAYFDGTGAIQLPALPIPSNTVTFSCWVNLSSIEASWNNAIFQLREDVDSDNQSSWAFMFSSQNWWIAPIYISVTSSSWDSWASGNAMNYYSINTWTWYNIVMTFNAWTAKFYVNGVLIETKNSSIYLRNYHDTTPSYIGAWYSRNYSESQYITWYVQDMIYENTVWSDQDVLDYYNLTKE